MKLENLAVMFIIFILPITLVLAAYTDAKVDTLKYQIDYDSKLDQATADAINAYKLNSYNSDESNIVNSRMENVAASVNSFFTSIGDSFDLAGLDKESIQAFVPAVVFTLYDGYYIYSPYTNTWDQETIDIVGTNDETYKNGEKLYGLKPYVYYSCRYVSASYDVVITYSLDSYITIKGMCDGKVVNLKGYLLSDVEKDASGNVTYRGIRIGTETNLKENVMIKGETEPRRLPCRKINGVKYYYDASTNEVFSVFNTIKTIATEITPDDILNNNNAIQYYQEAYDLKQAISTSSLKNIRASDAVDSDGTKLNTMEKYDRYQLDNTKIFDELFSSRTAIEDPKSDFYLHKANIIRYSVEKNLSVAISNYNNYEGANNNVNFKMPELKDYEWEDISTNVSMITFLQGLSIGGKIYNGYSVVSNNKTEEYVPESSIYILTSDGTYHTAKDEDLDAYNYLNGAVGYYNISFEVKRGYTNEGIVRYYYPIEGVTGCYKSIVNRRGEQEGNIYEIIDSNSDLASIYYTALGRERFGMYRTDNKINVEDTSTGGGGPIEPTPDPIDVTYNLVDNGDGTASLEIYATSNTGNTITSITNITQDGINRIDQNHYTINKNQSYEFRIVDSQGNVKTFRVDVGSLKTYNIVPNFEIVSIADDMQSLTLRVTATDTIAGGISSITNVTTQNITKQPGSDELYTITANGDYEFMITNINGVQETASVNIACLGNNNNVDSTIQVDSELAYNESNNTYLITLTANDSQGTIQEITNLTTENVVKISDRTYQVPNQEASYVFKIVSQKTNGSEESYFYRINVPVH